MNKLSAQFKSDQLVLFQWKLAALCCSDLLKLVSLGVFANLGKLVSLGIISKYRYVFYTYLYFYILYFYVCKSRYDKI